MYSVLARLIIYKAKIFAADGVMVSLACARAIVYCNSAMPSTKSRLINTLASEEGVLQPRVMI